MKGINLGLEALSASGISGRVDNTYISSYIQFNEAAFEVMDTCYQLDQLLTTYGTVKAIGNCIRKHGVTQSLESLYGENYRSAASMEEENAAAKETLWQKIRRIIEELLRKIKNFFTWLMDSGERARRRLSKISGKTGAFSWSGGQINSTKEFTDKARELIKKYDDGRTQIKNLESQLSQMKNDKNVREEAIGKIKDDIANAVKDNKSVVKQMNDLASAAEKAIKSGNKDAASKQLTTTPEETKEEKKDDDKNNFPKSQLDDEDWEERHPIVESKFRW